MPSDRIALALAVALMLTGCVGEVSESEPFAAPPGTQAGARPLGDGGTPAPGVEGDASLAPALDGSAPAPLYPHATVGTRCTADGLQEFLVLSTEPADCTTHAAAFESEDPTRFVRVALPAGVPSFGAAATLCDDRGGCAPTELDVRVTTSAAGASGEWSAVVGGVARTERFTATRCDFDAVLPPLGLAPTGDVALREVALYQGVKVTLARDGTAVAASAPIVAGRDGLLRAFVEPRPGFTARELVARVTLGEGPPLEARARISGASRDDDLGTTLNVTIPGARITPDASISVGVYEVSTSCGGADPGAAGARFPATGSATLPARTAGGTLRVVLVPVRYDADGSGRLPDTTQANVDAFRDHILSLFPVEAIDLAVRSEPMPWSAVVSSDGTGWSALLNECMNLRSRDGAPADTYYYCMFAPAPSFRDFCSRGCVSGLGPVPSPRDTFARASIGLGYRGAQGTFVHEVGHSMGRPHAPCGGVSGPDPSYPYSGGRIGSWGYDIVSGQLISPTDHADIMGYCDPTWISDYNFGLIFERIRTVRGIAALHGPPVRYATIVIDVDGSVSWGGEATMPIAPEGEPVDATWTDAAGATEDAQGIFVAVDHVDGGIVYVPMPEHDVTRLAIPRFGEIAVP